MLNNALHFRRMILLFTNLLSYSRASAADCAALQEILKMAESNKWMPAAVFGGLATIAGAIFFNKPTAPTAPAAPDAITITAAQPTAAPSAALTASTPASQVVTSAPQVAEVKPTPAPQAEPAPVPARPKVAHKRVSKPAPVAAPVPTDESTYSAGPIRVEQAPPPPPPVCPESEPRYIGQVAGAVGGAVVGGALGSMFGKGQGKDAMRILGAVAGGYGGSQTVGKPIDAAAMNKEQAEMSRRTGCQARTYQ